MKRDIFNLLDTYQEDSVQLQGETPLSSKRIKELTLSKLPAQKTTVKRGLRTSLVRGILVAALVTSLFCVAAVAISATLRDAARADMGISTSAPIPEWTEYDATQTSQPSPVRLASTLCSGDQLCAYLEVSPIPEDMAAILAQNGSSQYEWDCGIDPRGCAWLVQQTGYDPQTQTALVKVSLSGPPLEEAEEVHLSLTLYHQFKPERRYETVTVPLTDSQCVSLSTDIAVTNTKKQLEAELEAADVAQLPDYESEGRITRVSLYAGYIEVQLETPALAQWESVSHVGRLTPQLEGPPGDDTAWFAEMLFYNSWYLAVNETLSNVVLHHTDGTQTALNQLPRVYAGVWIEASNDNAAIYAGTQRYRFVPQHAFDLRCISSITIGGINYPLSATEDISS